MTSVAEFLGARREGDGLTFTIPRELHGAFGGAFGGVVAAACLVAARTAAPDRVPAALDCRFVRGLAAGDARATTAVVHAGRSLHCVAVEMHDANGRLATHATVSLVDPAVLSAIDRPSAPRPAWHSYEHGRSWGSSEIAPIVGTLQPRVVGSDERGIATAVQVPWSPAGAEAESACVAADLCVGPPVAAGVAGERVLHPNPDISLRFAREFDTTELVGNGRLAAVGAGVAAVEIEVWTHDALVAVGVSTSLLLPVR